MKNLKLKETLQKVMIDVFDKKSEKREISKLIKDAINNSSDYQKAYADYIEAKDKMKSIKNDIMKNFSSEQERLDEVNKIIADKMEAASELSVEMAKNGEDIELELGNRLYEPKFKVNFKKTDKRIKKQRSILEMGFDD